MSIVFNSCIAPITDITGPLYHLIRGDNKSPSYYWEQGISPEQEQLRSLFLALFRTATIAAFFFVLNPHRIFGVQSNISDGFAFAAQWLIHPYAAALLNAFTNVYPLIAKMIALLSKHQFFNATDYVGGFFRMIAFCFIAQRLKNDPSALDKGYSLLSLLFAARLSKAPEPPRQPPPSQIDPD